MATASSGLSVKASSQGWSTGRIAEGRPPRNYAGLTQDAAVLHPVFIGLILELPLGKAPPLGTNNVPAATASTWTRACEASLASMGPHVRGREIGGESKTVIVRKFSGRHEDDTKFFPGLVAAVNAPIAESRRSDHTRDPVRIPIAGTRPRPDSSSPCQESILSQTYSEQTAARVESRWQLIPDRDIPPKRKDHSGSIDVSWRPMRRTGKAARIR